MIPVPNQILSAADATLGKRASDRDLPQERSMAGTVKAFNAIFGTNLTEHQGWMFMVILKAKRSAVGPYKEDDFVDGSAYFALAAEARKSEWEASQLQKLAQPVLDEARDIASQEAWKAE